MFNSSRSVFEHEIIVLLYMNESMPFANIRGGAFLPPLRMKMVQSVKRCLAMSFQVCSYCVQKAENKNQFSLRNYAHLGISFYIDEIMFT